jgi:polyol permease family
MITEQSSVGRLATRVGVPPALVLGYVGLLLFMTGDGVESGFIAPFLTDNGAGSDIRSGYILTAYGLTVMLASWLSGALSQLWGPKRVMWIGFSIWVAFEILFLAVAVPSHSYALMLITYGIRGFGYPLFAYSFLVWVTAVAPKPRLGAAVGWFYFAFTGGLPSLGSFVASLTTGPLGHLGTLWLSFGLLIAGGLIALLGVREGTGSRRLAAPDVRPVESLLSSVSIAWERPRVGLGAIARLINAVPIFGMFVFFPRVFSDEIGFGEQRWLALVGVIYGSAVVFNLLIGNLSDRIGWRNTVFWFGCIGCSITIALLYFVPVALGAGYYWVALLVGALFGMTLSGWVALSALVPSMAPENKGGAMALLNLGAGASAFVGPLIPSLFLASIGPAGVVIVFSALYLAAAVMVWFCRLPHELDHGHHVLEEIGEDMAAVPVTHHHTDKGHA